MEEARLSECGAGYTIYSNGVRARQTLASESETFTFKVDEPSTALELCVAANSCAGPSEHSVKVVYTAGPPESPELVW